MDPSSYNQSQSGAAGTPPAPQPTYATQPGVSAVPQHVPNFDPMRPPMPQTTTPTAQPQPTVAAQYQQSTAIPAGPAASVAPTPMTSTMAQPEAGPVVGGAPANTAAGPGTKAVQNPNSTQNTLQVAEIRDGIVIMSDGSFRSVVMVKSINFDLMSQQEQEAVEYSYQGFLNSLYFPIQIFIRSQKVDLQQYIAKLEKIRSEHDNMLLALLMEDYISYIAQLAEQTNIMDKKFYVVIPYFPQVDIQKSLTSSKNFLSGLMSLFDAKEKHVVINEEDLEKAKTELRNRVQAVLGGLLQSGVQGLPLDTQELIELFYDTYNPDTATRQQLKNFGQLDADVVTKGQGSVTQAHLQRELN